MHSVAAWDHWTRPVRRGSSSKLNAFFFIIFLFCFVFLSFFFLCVLYRGLERGRGFWSGCKWRQAIGGGVESLDSRGCC